ncbi:MAG: dTDP-glucose 4,6-dehydratase [Oscillospiraceae bacterium]|jgi:dTDP-glucose 4,6-dehydratase|nr:dTDP-glucose 4,6-dehydratase [Oscillospiraceae bacterium]
MHLLITGAAGFIGSNFSYYWREQHPEDTLVLLDSLTYAGNYHTIAPLLQEPGVRFAYIDVTDRANIEDLFQRERFSAVVNFAAESFVDRSIEAPEVFLRSNILGTQVLMDACLTQGGVRFHQVSTDEVYGELPLERPDLFFTEETNLQTSSPYSASKAAADLLALAYCRTYGLHVTISRCSNNYGPYQFPEKLIPKMILFALENKPLPVYGKGANIRDWLHVRDHCRAIDLILRGGAPGEIYNVGGHNERDNLTVVKAILGMLGKPESLISYVADRAGHDLRYAIDPAKIHKDLGWLPKIRLEEGLRETVGWYLANQPWWKKILDGSYRINGNVFGAGA